jgi:O-antigen/teichoic acid export membrane protein
VTLDRVAPAPAAGIRERMARALAWNTVGTAFNQGSTFFVNVVLAHLLTREAFGQYGMIQSTLSVVAALAPLSSGYTATKYTAEYRESDGGKAGRVLGLCAAVSTVMGVVAAAALVAGAPRLAELLREPQLTSGLMIAGAVVLFSVVNAFLMGALAGFESYPSLGKAGIASGLLYIACCATGGVLWGVNGALAGAAVTGLVQSAILWWMVHRESVRRRIPIDLQGAWLEMGVVLRFSLPAALNGFVSLPAVWMANAVLVQQAGGYDQMALFTAANSFRIIVLFLPNILNSVGMSLLNNQLGAGDERRFRRLFWTNLAVTGAIVLAGCAGIALLGPWLLGLFGQQFRPAYPVLLVLMGAALAESLSLAVFQIIQARGRIWLSFVGVVSPAYVTLVVVSAALAPRVGALGVAWGYLGCWCVSLAAVTAIVGRLGVWSPAPVAGRGGAA